MVPLLGAISYTMITVNNPSLNRTLDNVVIVDVIYLFLLCTKYTA